MDFLKGLFLVLFTGMLILNMSIDNTHYKKYLIKGIIVSVIVLVILFALPYLVQVDADYEKHDELNILLV